MERSKRRAIFELRYNPIVSIFDSRGAILKSIKDSLGNKVTHWRVEDSSVTYTDSDTNSKLQVLVKHDRASLVSEDHVDDKQPLADAIKVFQSLMSLFPEELSKTGRIGVRYLDLFSSKKFKSFNDALAVVNKGFLSQSLPFTVKNKDVRITVNHENGMYNVGPVRCDEQFVQEIYSNPKSNIPKVALSIDVDSFIASTSWKSPEDVMRTVSAVDSMTKSLQKEVVMYCEGLVNESQQ